MTKLTFFGGNKAGNGAWLANTGYYKYARSILRAAYIVNNLDINYTSNKLINFYETLPSDPNFAQEVAVYFNTHPYDYTSTDGLALLSILDAPNQNIASIADISKLTRLTSNHAKSPQIVMEILNEGIFCFKKFPSYKKIEHYKLSLQVISIKALFYSSSIK